jgi:hypothetical protein
MLDGLLGAHLGAATSSSNLLVGSAPPLAEARVTKAGRDRRVDARFMRRLYPDLPAWVERNVGAGFTIQDAKINQGTLAITLFSQIPGQVDQVRIDFAPGDSSP